jgi:hypothetical protein
VILKIGPFGILVGTRKLLVWQGSGCGGHGLQFQKRSIGKLEADDFPGKGFLAKRLELRLSFFREPPKTAFRG